MSSINPIDYDFEPLSPNEKLDPLYERHDDTFKILNTGFQDEIFNFYDNQNKALTDAQLEHIYIQRFKRFNKDYIVDTGKSYIKKYKKYIYEIYGKNSPLF